MDYFNNKRYAIAIDRFQRVRAEFPFAPEVTAAELKLAEAHYLNKQYPEAIAAFKEFQTLHPKSEHIPFVAYHLGLAYFDQFTNVDRDQKTTEIAKGYFETLLKDHPSSPYAAKAKEKLAKCVEYLAQHEFNIASFYMREGKYPAAINRFEAVVRNYRDTPLASKALYNLAESYRMDKNSLKAALAYEALIRHYPQDPLAKSAQTRLAEVSRERHDPLVLLLKQDGRPIPPTEPARAATTGREQERSQERSPIDFVAKKEVAREEPGNDKGVVSRMLSAVNPFSRADSEPTDKPDNRTAASTNGESKGFFSSFFSGLNPFGGSGKLQTQTERDPELVGRIDSSLKSQGIANRGDAVTVAPEANLPQVERTAAEATAPQVDPAVVLNEIDARLKKQGKDSAAMPAPPEAAPGLRSASAAATAAAKSQQAGPSAQTTGLAATIDERLKKQGITPPPDASPEAGQSSASAPRAKPEPKSVELAPRIATDQRGPLFLEAGEGQVRERAPVTDNVSRPSEPSPATTVQAEPQVGETLSDTILKKSASQAQGTTRTEPKSGDKSPSPPEETEKKGTFDQLREDLKRAGNIFNPFNW
jgi:outer membrane protein assembly factor BamD